MPNPEEFKPEQSSEEKLKSIERNITALKERAEKARADKEQYIKKKMVDRETFIAASKQVDDLYQKALQTKESLAPLEEQEELKGDPDLQKQIKEADELVSELENQQQEIQKEIAKIEGQPEILDKVWDEAKTQDKAWEKGKETEQATAELAQEAKAFAEKINEYTKKYNEWFEKQDKDNEVLQDARDVIVKEVNTTLKMCDAGSLGNEVRDVINGIDKPNIKIEEFETALTELEKTRKSLGMFSNRSVKNAISYLLSQKEKFEAYKAAGVQRDSHQQNRADAGFDELVA